MSKKEKTAPIILFGDNRLRTICSPVTVFHKGLQEKTDLIANTLRDHGGGAALAAPQIAILKRIVVINYLGEYYELINPVIIEKSGEQTDMEGCLSLPGLWGNVKRYAQIKVDYQDRNGESHSVEVKNEMARCFQHEIDHLDGILFIHRMTDEYVFNNETQEKVSVKSLIELTGAKK